MEFATSTATVYGFFTYSFFLFHMLVYTGIFFLALYAIFFGISALYNAIFRLTTAGDNFLR